MNIDFLETVQEPDSCNIIAAEDASKEFARLSARLIAVTTSAHHLAGHLGSQKSVTLRQLKEKAELQLCKNLTEVRSAIEHVTGALHKYAGELHEHCSAAAKIRASAVLCCNNLRVLQNLSTSTPGNSVYDYRITQLEAELNSLQQAWIKNAAAAKSCDLALERAFKSQILPAIHIAQIATGDSVLRVFQASSDAAAANDPLLLGALVTIASDSVAPAITRQQAAMALLKLAILNPAKVYKQMGFTAEDLTLTTFISQTKALAASVGLLAGVPGLVTSVKLKPTGAGYPVLDCFGRSRGQLVAQIHLGDVAQAQQLVVLVPGMGSNVGGADNCIGALNTLKDKLKESDPQLASKTAMIVWLGYDSPGLFEEPGINHAQAGAAKLSSDLEVWQSLESRPKITVIGHSYGSTTAAFALQQLKTPVNRFIAIGSAGLHDSVNYNRIQATRVYAATAEPDVNSWQIDSPSGSTLATGQHNMHAHISSIVLAGLFASDHVAPIGRRTGRHRVDPRHLPGAQVLSVNSVKSSAGAPVGSHSLFLNLQQSQGLKRRGYLDEDSQAVAQITDILADRAKNNGGKNATAG